MDENPYKAPQTKRARFIPIFTVWFALAFIVHVFVVGVHPEARYDDGSVWGLLVRTFAAWGLPLWLPLLADLGFLAVPVGLACCMLIDLAIQKRRVKRAGRR